jgi:hypothetical protein
VKVPDFHRHFMRFCHIWIGLGAARDQNPKRHFGVDDISAVEALHGTYRVTEQRDLSSKDHYEDFWRGTVEGVRARIDRGERDPLTIVNQIEFERQDALNSAYLEDRPAEAGFKSLAGLRLRAASYDEVVSLVPGARNADQYFYHLLVKHCDAGVDAIVELGSGYGRNIIWMNALLRDRSRDIDYHCLELTESGRECTNLLASLNPDLKIRTTPFDYMAPDFSTLSGYRKILFFSIASVEQVATLPDAFLENMLGLDAEITCAQMEPVGWQRHGDLNQLIELARREKDAQPISSEALYDFIKQRLPRGDNDIGPGVMDVRAAVYAERRGYNANYLSLISRFQQRGTIEVQYFHPNIAGGAQYPSTLIGWRKRV